MKLRYGGHLAYCTNIHRGETWPQTFETLQRYTLAVKARVCPMEPYAIGLRLSDQASRELSEPSTLTAFQHWLEANDCYVFTINGFPYGVFHGARVKEHVYQPDWTEVERVNYTNRLFDLLSVLLPKGLEGSVSTVPGSFKEFITSPEQVAAMRRNLWSSVEHISRVSERTGQRLHLGLEPEPLCYLETSLETVRFFEELRADRPSDERLNRYLGVNYDNCHLAVEYEQPQEVIRTFKEHNVKISKLHLSSALKVKATPESRHELESFVDRVYFHQVIAKSDKGEIRRFKDLDVALAAAKNDNSRLEEWRIHFHIPLHADPRGYFQSTSDHILGMLDWLKDDPGLCSHLEMETYTWEVLPAQMKNLNVVDQLVLEYDWTLGHLAQRGLADWHGLP